MPIFEVESKYNEDKPAYILEQITNKDLGTMYLINEECLVARSSGEIMFFKQVTDPFTFIKEWVNYKTLNIMGFLYWTKGNSRI